MAKIVDSLPSRPLTKGEVLSMKDRAREYCIRPESDEAFVICLLGDEGVHGIGFDVGTEEWVRFYTTDTDYSDEAFDEFEDAIYDWAKSQYGERLGVGDLEMVGPSDPSVEAKESERPEEVEMGLEPEYDCPDCDYYKTGLMTSPQSFLEHLRSEHGYSDSESTEVLHG